MEGITRRVLTKSEWALVDDKTDLVCQPWVHKMRRIH
jgi:hypothetical protein